MRDPVYKADRIKLTNAGWTRTHKNSMYWKHPTLNIVVSTEEAVRITNITNYNKVNTEEYKQELIEVTRGSIMELRDKIEQLKGLIAEYNVTLSLSLDVGTCNLCKIGMNSKTGHRVGCICNDAHNLIARLNLSDGVEQEDEEEVEVSDEHDFSA